VGITVTVAGTIRVAVGAVMGNNAGTAAGIILGARTGNSVGAAIGIFVLVILGIVAAADTGAVLGADAGIFASGDVGIVAEFASSFFVAVLEPGTGAPLEVEISASPNVLPPSGVAIAALQQPNKARVSNVKLRISFLKTFHH